MKSWWLQLHDMSKTGKSIGTESKLVVAYGLEDWGEIGSNC